MRLNNNIFLYIAIFLVLGGELFAGYCIISWSLYYKLLGLCLHIILVYLFSSIVKKLKIDDSHIDFNFTLVSFILTSVLPVYGMLGMIFIYLTLRFIKVQPVEYFQVDESFLPKPSYFTLKDADKSIVNIKKEELDIEAFTDIFKSNDRQLEEVAVNKLSKIVNKRSVSLLQGVVENSTTDTKVLAASALIEMENKIINKIEEIRISVEDDPEQVMAILELARTYDLYCYLGVLDVAVNNHYQKLALVQYQIYLDYHPTDAEAVLEYGRILLSCGKFDEAIQTLIKAKDFSPHNPNPLIWLAEAYYESEDYLAVQGICQKLCSLQNLPENFKPVVNLWAVGEPLNSIKPAENVIQEES